VSMSTFRWSDVVNAARNQFATLPPADFAAADRQLIMLQRLLQTFPTEGWSVLSLNDTVIFTLNAEHRPDGWSQPDKTRDSHAIVLDRRDTLRFLWAPAAFASADPWRVLASMSAVFPLFERPGGSGAFTDAELRAGHRVVQRVDHHEDPQPGQPQPYCPFDPELPREA
jgi:hypothetical protein